MITELFTNNGRSQIPATVGNQTSIAIVHDINERAGILPKFPSPEKAIDMMGESIARHMDYQNLSSMLGDRIGKAIERNGKSHSTLEEAANDLGIAPDTLSQWVQDGRLGCAKIGGKNSYFLKSEIEKTIAENYRCNPRKQTNRERVESVLFGK